MFKCSNKKKTSPKYKCDAKDNKMENAAGHWKTSESRENPQEDTA